MACDRLLIPHIPDDTNTVFNRNKLNELWGYGSSFAEIILCNIADSIVFEMALFRMLPPSVFYKTCGSVSLLSFSYYV